MTAVFAVGAEPCQIPEFLPFFTMLRCVEGNSIGRARRCSATSLSIFAIGTPTRTNAFHSAFKPNSDEISFPNSGAPSVGDVGTLLEVLHAPGLDNRYVVECVHDTDGTTVWLSDFSEDELEPVT